MPKTCVGFINFSIFCMCRLIFFVLWNWQRMPLKTLSSLQPENVWPYSLKILMTIRTLLKFKKSIEVRSYKSIKIYTSHLPKYSNHLVHLNSLQNKEVTQTRPICWWDVSKRITPRFFNTCILSKMHQHFTLKVGITFWHTIIQKSPNRWTCGV